MKCTAMIAAAALIAGCASTETKPDANATDAQMAFARLKLLVGRWNAKLPDEAAPTPAETTAPTETPPTAPTPEPAAEHPPAPTPQAGGEKPVQSGAEKPAEPAKPEQERGAATAAGAAPAGETKAATLVVEYSVTSGGHTLMEKLMAGTKEEMVTLYYLEGGGLALVHYCSIGNRPHMRLDVAHSTRDDLHFEWDGTATDINPKKDPHIHRGRIHFVDADTIECEWYFWADGKESHKKEFTLSRTAGAFTPLPK